MPEHTGFLTFLLAHLPGLRENAKNLGHTFIGHEPMSYHSVEPIFSSMIILLVFIGMSIAVRGKFRRLDESVVPDDRLSLRTFFEAFFGYFYNMAKDVMGPENAKRYFPLIGGAAGFIFFSNVSGLIPGFSPPTSSLNVTLGCALLVFLSFNIWGIKQNGWSYIAHLAGPKWYLAPLIFPIEVISTCVRPITLSVRLMVNIAVDHLIASVFFGLVAIFLPLPVMMLGLIVIVVQTLVFCLLSSIYIGLATEHHHAEHH
ncbi:F0F1 ATP synthase subunit A [Polyangium spumosum]|uniref:ATP synthase subunit a n=1 Tax=Polyangium spumosum TaxID=889282 RepID=A0A6N7PZ60_9BACT|nr:F0F1 ATP synthase subunit A [Polyangium spumosum]MRG96847.1 F0F1 ATP synthase subunit A [Polyangium spumosum]